MSRQITIHGRVERVVELPETWPDSAIEAAQIKVFRDDIYILHPNHLPCQLVNGKWKTFWGYID